MNHSEEYIKNEKLANRYAEKYFNQRKEDIISFIKENDEKYIGSMKDGVKWTDYIYSHCYNSLMGISICVLIKGEKGDKKYYLSSIVYPQIIELYRITSKQ